MVEMKKVGIYVSILFIISAVVLCILFGFKSIEKENAQYFYKREQVVNLYHDNKELFNSVVTVMSKTDDEYILTSPSADKMHGEDSDFEQQVLYITEELGITDIYKRKDDDYIMMYQNKPTVRNDIEVGLTYHIPTGEWRYYYYHNYDTCHHKCKYVYMLYDLLFNGEKAIF